MKFLHCFSDFVYISIYTNDNFVVTAGLFIRLIYSLVWTYELRKQLELGRTSIP